MTPYSSLVSDTPGVVHLSIGEIGFHVPIRAAVAESRPRDFNGMLKL